MKKIFLTACLLFTFSLSFAQKHEYRPQTEKSYAILKEVLPVVSDADIKKFSKTAAKPENVKLVNDILFFLKYRRLINKDTPIPKIYLADIISSKELHYNGGLYFPQKKIIVLNAGLLNGDPSYKAYNFINFSTILAHEIKHHEDTVNKVKYPSAAVTEKNAYEQSVKILDAFLRMNEEAAATIDIEYFYQIIQANRDYIANLRQNQLLMMKAADIMLKNKKAICKKLGINEKVFNMFGFMPEVEFNAKNGGHIVNVDASFSQKIQPLRFAANTISEEVEILNPPKEIILFKNQVKNIDKRMFL
jgi:hypothetical protein